MGWGGGGGGGRTHLLSFRDCILISNTHGTFNWTKKHTNSKDHGIWNAIGQCGRVCCDNNIYRTRRDPHFHNYIARFACLNHPLNIMAAAMANIPNTIAIFSSKSYLGIQWLCGMSMQHPAAMSMCWCISTNCCIIWNYLVTPMHSCHAIQVLGCLPAIAQGMLKAGPQSKPASLEPKTNFHPNM